MKFQISKYMKKMIIPKGVENMLYLLFMVSVLAACVLVGVVIGNKPKMSATNIALEQLERKENIIYAYNSLLHKVWIDNPNYVENVLTETDEFVSLANLLNGDFQHAFELDSEEDSIQYNVNWEHGR